MSGHGTRIRITVPWTPSESAVLFLSWDYATDLSLPAGGASGRRQTRVPMNVKLLDKCAKKQSNQDRPAKSEWRFMMVS